MRVGRDRDGVSLSAARFCGEVKNFCLEFSMECAGEASGMFLVTLHVASLNVLILLWRPSFRNHHPAPHRHKMHARLESVFHRFPMCNSSATAASPLKCASHVMSAGALRVLCHFFSIPKFCKKPNFSASAFDVQWRSDSVQRHARPHRSGTQRMFLASMAACGRGGIEQNMSMSPRPTDHRGTREREREQEKKAADPRTEEGRGISVAPILS